MYQVMTRFVALAALLSASCSTLPDSRWTYVADGNDASTFYVDVSSITAKSDHIEAWELADYLDDGSDWKSIKTLVYYKCGSLAAAKQQSVFLSGSMGGGRETKVVHHGESYSTATPGTASEHLNKFVCSKARGGA